MSGQLALLLAEDQVVARRCGRRCRRRCGRRLRSCWRGCWRRRWLAMSEFSKITERHRQRRAVVYVRLSTPGEVERNTESAARQYALAERAVELGWPAGSCWWWMRTPACPLGGRTP
jgi:hypothetical protein